MKKFLALLLALSLMLSLSACFGKPDTPTAPISGIPTAEADDDISDDDTEINEDPSRTEESDRKEIESNLRDARELIKDGYFEDATMIIDSLKTRDLTDSERKELLQLQKQMIKVSD